ncbi:glycosyltransferase [Christiangramia aquimixticola]|uniref:glycosyltransferase n=1 Tax=Christiangramia aquimixticola TaxID=1697558 RepID=UPI003AA96292
MSKKIRVLHIIKSLGRGGAEMLLPETLKLHDSQRFEFHYVYFLPWKNQMVSAIENNNGVVHCFKASNNIQIMLEANKIANYVVEHKINIIHCHLPWAGFLGRLVHQKTNIPLVYTEHNMQERYHWVTKFLNRVSFNSQSLAIGVSEDVSSSILKNIKPKIPVVTLLNGVNTKKYKKKNLVGLHEELNIPSDAFVVGVVAVFRFQKRLKEWMQVFKKFSDKNPNVCGIIIGDGPLKKELIAERKALNLEDKILMPGLQTETRPYFEIMDVFMMTSSFEGLPIALLEAMSMECAIVSTDAGGIKEVLEDGKNGLMVTVNNWEDLVEKLEILMKSEEEKTRLQKAARLRVLEKFSMESMVKKLELNYLKLLENGN